MTAVHYSEQELQSMSDADLFAAAAVAVFGQADALSGSSSWDAFGRIVEQLWERGYTLHCRAFEQSHLDLMNNLPSNLKQGKHYRRAEVSVTDVHKRLFLPPTTPILECMAESLPRAAAIAAIRVCQMERLPCTLPAADPSALPSGKEVAWTEERRRHQSERMKRYWKRQHAARGKKAARS